MQNLQLLQPATIESAGSDKINYLNIATEYFKHGIMCMPVEQDKRPAQPWGDFNKSTSVISLKKDWNWQKPAIGIITGAASNDLVVVDVDLKYDLNIGTPENIYDLWQAQLPATISLNLVVAKTRSGGFHVYYRCPGSKVGNEKLANRYTTEEERQIHPKEKVKVLIETRGQGGYAVCAPSPGYEWIEGGPDNIKVFTLEEEKIILDAARALDQVIAEARPNRSIEKKVSNSSNTSYEIMPSDDYDAKCNVDALLTRNSWTYVESKGCKDHYKRPGSTEAKTSGNWDHDLGLFSVFSTSTEFETDYGYTPTALYAKLEHNGDLSAACKALSKEGYGRKASIFLQGKSTTVLPANISLQVHPQHTEILSQLVNQIKPVDFEMIAFPQLEKMRNELKELEKKITNPDGSFNSGDKMAFHSFQELSEAINKLKVNEKHLVIISVDETVRHAIDNSWNLCKNQLFIYLYNGAFWSNLDEKVFKKFLSEASQRMGVSKWSAKHFEFSDKLLKQFLFSAYLATPEPDPHTVLVNLLNGTFKIEANNVPKLQQFNSEDFLTYQLPFDYNPEAKAPLFVKYLDRVLPDKDKQMVLAEYIGYVFTNLKLEKALLLFGSGANGKSVFFEVIQALLGKENTSNFSLQSLTDETGYYRAKISNKLVNYASEISGKLEASLFKQLVSGEPVPARLPYGEPFTVSKYAKLIFNCNILPKEVEHTDGFFRRFLIVNFDETIPESEQVKDLHEQIIASELSGVFNWVLEGLNRLLTKKSFTKSLAISDAGKKYESESDNVVSFIDHKLYVPAISRHEKIPLGIMYSEYVEYCRNSGFNPLNSTNFSVRLQRLKFHVKRRNEGKIVFAKTGGVDPEIKKMYEAEDDILFPSDVIKDEETEVPPF